MSKANPTVQIEEGVWYKIAFGKAPWYEECCGCSLVHRTDFKVDDGIFWVKYTVDKRRTNKARKARVKD